jgi:hypothetical protein
MIAWNGGPKPTQCGCFWPQYQLQWWIIQNGVSYDILKKLQVVDTYQELLKTRNGFGELSLQEVAREAHVSHTYVNKVLDELNSGSGILDPQLNKRQYLKGPGARTLDSHDVACLIILLGQNPS